METISKESIIKLGRGKGIEILNEIKKAKTQVKAVSPYLSPDYIKELILLHKKGVDITLITCDNLETNQWSDFKPSDIILRDKIEDVKLKKLKKSLYHISIILFLVSIPSFSLIFLNQDLYLIPIAIILISLMIFGIESAIKDFKYDYRTIFRLKVFDSKSGINPQSTNLIHSKIFLIDNKILFLGSANFTYSAFKTHYETIIKILDPKAIEDVEEEIENIFNSRELKEKSWESLL